VVCGHIHHAEIRAIGRITYHNCGDWVESCTALAEDHAGRIRVLQMPREVRPAAAPPALALAGNA
jgi:UDP-2,3-diacylglucosamine pyrophosphatase LpxH